MAKQMEYLLAVTVQALAEQRLRTYIACGIEEVEDWRAKLDAWYAAGYLENDLAFEALALAESELDSAWGEKDDPEDGPQWARDLTDTIAAKLQELNLARETGA